MVPCGPPCDSNRFADRPAPLPVIARHRLSEGGHGPRPAIGTGGDSYFAKWHSDPDHHERRRSSEPPLVRRCFISAPADAAVVPLVQALKDRGWEPFLLSDVATLGSSLTESVQDAIHGPTS